MAFHTSNITGEALSNDPANAYGDADAVRELWAKGVEVYEQTTDFFASMEGGADAVIETINDTSKGRGQKITFTQMAGLYNEPKHGDELFNDENDFESIKLHTSELKVDYLRHGVRYTERSEEFMGMRGEIAVGIPRELGKWMGRQKSEKLFMMFLHKGSAENEIYSGNKANIDGLVSANTLDWDTIVAAQTQLSRLNGLPAKVGTDKNGNAINRYCVVATTDALFSLEQDGDFKTALQDSGPDGYDNVQFTGGYTDIRGNMIKKYNPIDHDGYGAVGSPLNPVGKLGCTTTDGFASSTISSGAGAINTIYGGGSLAAGILTAKAYFKYFPKYAFKFLATDTLALGSSLYGSGDFYVAVVNHANAPVDPGKIGYYRVTTNGGNTLTLVNGTAGRFATGTVHANFTALEAKIGAFATATTNATISHTAGSASVYLINNIGVPIGHTLFLGRQAARRGYGKHRNMRSEDEHEGGFVKDVFVTSVFGQEPSEDAAGRKPAYLIITHAVQYAGVPFKNVT